MSDSKLRYGSPMDEGERKGPPKPTPARQAIAANLRYLRQHYRHGFLTGLTPEELAIGLDNALSAKTIRRLEDPFHDTTPNLDTIDILAHFFGITAWELIKPREQQPSVSGRERQTPHQPYHSATSKRQSASAHKKEKSAKS